MNAALAYSISRPYPFGNWFNYGSMVGFATLLILLTVFNLATNGYDMQTTYTNNPNVTLAQRHWFNSWAFTWGNVKLQAQCQQLEVPVGYQFLTSNLGFKYTVNSVDAKKDPGAEGIQQPAVLYLNNTLERCQVDAINIMLKKADQSQANGFWWSWSDSYATATASCQISGATGAMEVSIGMTWNAYQTSYNYVAMNNYTTHAPMWWATRMMNNYFTGLMWVTSGQLPDGNDQTPAYTTGQLNFNPGANDDMETFDPNNFSYWFIAANGGISNTDQSSMLNNKNFTFSRPMTEGFYFAKILRSAILVDLGNTNASNVLLNADSLQNMLKGSGDFNRNSRAPLNNGDGLDWWKVRGISPPGASLNSEHSAVAMEDTYNSFKDMMGPLTTKNASIYAQYVCSVPKAKSIPAMIFATLVADVALMQGALAIFGFFALRAAMRKNPTAMYCPGCEAHGLQFDDIDVGKRGSISHAKHVSSSSVLTRGSSSYGLLDNERHD